MDTKTVTFVLACSLAWYFSAGGCRKQGKAKSVEQEKPKSVKQEKPKSIGLPIANEKKPDTVDSTVLSAQKAMQHLCQRMDAFDTLYVYHDFASGGNADFIPSGWMGDVDNLACDEQWTKDEGARGETCIKISYAGGRWAGIYWQRPENNWGKKEPRAGRDMRGAKRLMFRARAQTDGTTVEIGLAGIDGEYGDSSGKQSERFRLTSRWQDCELDLDGMDLSHVVGGFLVVFAKPGTVFLDEIRYDLPRPGNRLRLIPSYVVPNRSPLYPVNRNAAHLYDNALVMIALSCRAKSKATTGKDRDEAKRRLKVLADSIVYAMNHDRHYRDGRLRNAYWGGGDFLDHKGRVRLPGWYDATKKQWFEDKYSVSTYTGNLAWAALGLIEAWETLENKKARGQYLQAAERIMSWIDANTRAEGKVGGFSGGYMGWEPNPKAPKGPEKLRWCSVEHNADILAAANRLARATGKAKWKEMAAHARGFLKRMFNSKDGHFWTGTGENGQINRAVVPLDPQTWTLLAMGDSPETRRALSWTEANLNAKASFSGLKLGGYTYGSVAKGIWPEGTAQMGLSFLQLGMVKKAEVCRKALGLIQQRHPGGDGLGLVAACKKLPTGFEGNFYYPELHIGATAWFYLLEMRYNPLAGKTVAHRQRGGAN